MRNVAWILLTWFFLNLVTSIATKIPLAYVMPEVVVVVAVFLAFERQAWTLVVCCLVLGYLVGRSALAPVGLHGLSLSITALGVQTLVGSISGGGRSFFAGCVTVATAIYHATVFSLLLVVRGHAVFPTWSTALLLPSALLTGALALVAYPSMLAFERRISTDQRESLSF